MKFYLPILSCIFILLMASSCNEKPDDQPIVNDDALTLLNVPNGFPSNLNIPADNPITKEKIKLGRYLFYDGRLSGTGCTCGVSCSKCHVISSAFANTENYGEEFKKLNTLSLVNTVFNSNYYFWKGDYYDQNNDVNKQNIEDIVLIKLNANWAMNSSEKAAVDAIKTVDYYPEMFNKAFGDDEITSERITMAIACFVRSLVSYDSKFHKWQRKEEGAQLTKTEMDCYELFMSTKGNCFHCHSLNGTGNSKFYNLGLSENFEKNRGRFDITFDSNDFGAYRVPSLLNVDLTPPYMHNGSFFTLEQVIDFLSDGIHSTPYTSSIFPSQMNNKGNFTTKEKEALLAFLKTLTDHSIKSNSNYTVPNDL